MVYLEPVALALSNKSGAPVKMVMSREEVFRASGPTSGAKDYVKVGAKNDGAITAEQARERFLAARDRLAAALGQNTDRADHDGDRDRDDAIGDSDRRDGLTEFQKGVAARAMATPPDQWSDGLKAAIRRAGWDADALAARVRRARQDEGGAVDLTVLGLTNTAIEESSWGEIKSEIQEK